MSRNSSTKKRKLSWLDLCEQEVSVDYYPKITFGTDSNSDDCLKPPQKVSLPEKVQQESSVCEKQRNMDRLLIQVEELEKKLKISNDSLKNEKVRRAKVESDCMFYKRENTELEQGLDYYQHTIETHEKTVQTLQNQLQSKETLCESLEKRSKQESLLRGNLAQERQKSENESIIISKLQKEMGELHKQNENLLNKLENFSSMKKEADEIMSAQLDTLKQQLEEKSSLCQQLESSFIREKQLRVQLQQEKKPQKKDLVHQRLKNEIRELENELSELEQGRDYHRKNAETCEKAMKSLQIELQNKETACEDLQETLKQVRVQLAQEQQNSQNKDTITENLKEEVIELKENLVKALESLNSTKIEEKKMSAQLDTLKHHLEEKSSLCQQLESSFNKEKQLRVQLQQEKKPQKKDLVHQRLKNEIRELENELSELEQGRDYHKKNAETCEKTIKTLQIELQNKETACEDLQETLKQVRVQLAQEQQNSQNKDTITENLKEEVGELKENLVKALESLNSTKIEEKKNMSKQLDTLKQQLEEKSALCQQLESSFNKEKQLRVQLQQEKKNQKKDLVHQRLKNEIRELENELSELEQGRDYHKKNAETCEKAMKTLQIELQNKETACEDLQETLKQVRVQLAQEQQNSQNKDTITENLKKEVGELKESFVKALESLNSTKIEVKEKMSQQLEVFNQQLEEKSALCQTLKSSLDKEQQLRVSCQAELNNTRVLVSDYSDLQQEIQDLKERNSELRDMMNKHVSEKVESDQQFVQELQKLKEQHEEELVTLKLQLTEHLSSEIQPGSEISSPEPQTSVESLETNPDEDCQTDVCQTEMDQETLELSQSLHSNESPSEEAVPQTVTPQQNVSKWRRFKKFMTPACLRKHKNKL